MNSDVYDMISVDNATKQGNIIVRMSCGRLTNYVQLFVITFSNMITIRHPYLHIQLSFNSVDFLFCSPPILSASFSSQNDYYQ